MAEAENMVAGYTGAFYDNALEIARNIATIEHSINNCREDIEKEPLWITETVGDRNPHDITKANPAWISYKDMIRTHADLVVRLKKIVGNNYTATDEDDGWDQLFEEMGKIR